MAAFLFRLLALVAMMLMPLGMNGAAVAAPAAAASEATHCGGHEQEPSEAPASADHEGCLACAALPALGHDAEAEALRSALPLLISAAHIFHGIEPEIATPPPRRA